MFNLKRDMLAAIPLIIAALLVTAEAADKVPVPVTTEKLADLIFFPIRDAPATAVSLNDTRLSAEISGLLKEITVKVGNHVEEGEVIARLDCRDYELTVSQAKSTYKSERAKKKFNTSQLEMAERLLKSNAISAEELDRRISSDAASTAELERVKATVEKAQRSVEKCSIKAPFNAVVIERIANLGDYVEAGTPIVRLLDQDDIEISAKIQEQDLEVLQQAVDPVFISHRQRYPVKLRTILPLMDSRLRSYETRLTFLQEPAAVGAAGRLEWKLSAGRIPYDLLVRRNDSLGIFLAENEHARFVPLPGAKEGQPAVVNLPDTIEVIVSGRFTIVDQDLIQIVQP